MEDLLVIKGFDDRLKVFGVINEFLIDRRWVREVRESIGLL